MDEQVRVSAKKPEAKRASSFTPTPKTDVSHSINSPIDQILHLQRTIGNQAVQRLLKSGMIQAKLRIGHPNDKYEQEADRVADEVMRMPEPGVQRQVEPEEEEEEEETLQPKPLVSQITPLVQVQRQEEPEEEEETLQAKPLTEQITPLVQRQVEPEEEEEEELVQPKAENSQSREITPDLESRIQSLKGSGQPLSESARAFFELRFGQDFSQVRVHTNTRAVETARALNAKAFTVGRDVVFGAGQYVPKSSESSQLLAHELTHVVQQEDGPSRAIRTRPQLQQLKTTRQVQCQEKPKVGPETPSTLVADEPEEVAKWERIGITLGPIYSMYGVREDIVTGTKFGNITFILSDAASGEVYYNYNSTIRKVTIGAFRLNVIGCGTLSEEVVKRTKFAKFVCKVYQYETIVILVIVRPDVAIDVAGRIIEGKSIVDEEAMREYLSTLVFGPMGKIKGLKVVKILMEDVVKPASESAFKQLLEEGKIDPSKIKKDALEAAFTNEIGKYVGNLPLDSKKLLKETNDKLRAISTGLLQKELGAGYKAAKSATE